jgi:hypothetical protein
LVQENIEFHQSGRNPNHAQTKALYKGIAEFVKTEAALRNSVWPVSLREPERRQKLPRKMEILSQTA